MDSCHQTAQRLCQPLGKPLGKHLDKQDFQRFILQMQKLRIIKLLLAKFAISESGFTM
jgi:hypothetical protein